MNVANRNYPQMPASRKHSLKPKPSASLPDEALIDLFHRQTFRFFWEGAHPVCSLARDRSGLAMDPDDDLVCTGGVNASSPIACGARAPLASSCRPSCGHP